MLWWHWSILGFEPSWSGNPYLRWAWEFLFPLLWNGRIDGERVHLGWACRSRLDPMVSVCHSRHHFSARDEKAFAEQKEPEWKRRA